MKKYNIIDLFCGCGGLSEGFRQAGYEIIAGIDFNKAAIETYSKNFGGVGHCLDLLNLELEDIKKIIKERKIDVIIGGPPCQGFSSANRYKIEGDDPRNKLFFEFVKFVDFLQPKAIVIENVSGIVTNNNGYAKDKIYEIFSKRGYNVNHKILIASDYGVPQKRRRNFFVMIKDCKFDFDSIERNSNIVTVKDAIGDLYNFEENIKGSFIINNEPKSTYQTLMKNKEYSIFNHEVRYPAKKVQHRISFVPQGGNWTSVPSNLWPSVRNNRQSSAYKRLQENNVSVTIDTGNNHSNYFHPLYNRIPTVREAARIQSFSDSFVFCGNRSEQYRQVGNAVPPLLSKAIATALLEVLKDE